jgi:hypothetical protein
VKPVINGIAGGDRSVCRGEGAVDYFDGEE